MATKIQYLLSRLYNNITEFQQQNYYVETKHNEIIYQTDHQQRNGF